MVEEEVTRLGILISELPHSPPLPRYAVISCRQAYQRKTSSIWRFEYFLHVWVITELVDLTQVPSDDKAYAHWPFIFPCIYAGGTPDVNKQHVLFS
jgi:hypothetical protein